MNTTIRTAGSAEPLLGFLSRSRTASNDDNVIDSRVIRLSQLRVEGGPALAVMKVARDLGGATQLRTQRRLVAEVVSQPGLDRAWSELVPRILAFDERADSTVCVESYRPGVRLADVLADHPHRYQELVAMALSAIAPLHQATAKPVVVDNLSAVRQWVVDPVGELADNCGQLHPAFAPALERLETALTRAIVGRRMAVCWTHGGYQPDTVQLAGAEGPVNRIVAWDQARGDRPALIDAYLMLLTASAQVAGTDLGEIVSQRLIAGGLSDDERTVLYAATPPGIAAADAHWLDEQVAILLAWLHHSAATCRSIADRPGRNDWLAANVVPVLDALTSWRGFSAADRSVAS